MIIPSLVARVKYFEKLSGVSFGGFLLVPSGSTVPDTRQLFGCQRSLFTVSGQICPHDLGGIGRVLAVIVAPSDALVKLYGILPTDFVNLVATDCLARVTNGGIIVAALNGSNRFNDPIPVDIGSGGLQIGREKKAEDDEEEFCVLHALL